MDQARGGCQFQTPGIIVDGTGKVDNWSGGSAGFEVHYLSTDANGVESYDMISPNDGYGPQVLRVLRPANPAPGVAHNFLFMLPFEPGLGTTYGDGLATIEAANLQNQYNLQVIASPDGDIVWVSGVLPGSVHDKKAEWIWACSPNWRKPA